MTLAELRALAEQATPGPWTEERQSVYASDAIIAEVVLDIHSDDTWPSPADARYIAACYPETVLALVGAAEAAQALKETGAWNTAGPPSRAILDAEANLEKALTALVTADQERA